MINHRPTSHRWVAPLVVLLVVFATLPATVMARPIDGPGMPHPDSAPTTPSIVRTVVEEQSVSVLPIALAGAALLVAIAGTGYALFRIAPLRQQLGVGH
jgi:hypothetical protein